MNIKRSTLLIIPLLAGLFGGCTTNPGAVPLDLGQPTFPSFSHDTSPAPPNYYWLEPMPFANEDRD
jgi:hypothetical protein